MAAPLDMLESFCTKLRGEFKPFSAELFTRITSLMAKLYVVVVFQLISLFIIVNSNFKYNFKSINRESYYLSSEFHNSAIIIQHFKDYMNNQLYYK